MITAGIDCGAKSTRAVLIKDGVIAGRGLVLTGFDQVKAVQESLEKALRDFQIIEDQIDRIGGTGSGKDSIINADIHVNDIKAMSKAAAFFFPNARTVIDVGAEEGRVAKVDKNGNPVDFAVNGKCAAGAGSFIEAMARALEISLEAMGKLSLKSNKSIPMNSQCVVFAESEVVGLIHAKTEKNDICKAIHDSMANRIASMIRRIGIEEDVSMIGGVSYNPGFLDSLKRELHLDKILIPEMPEYGAAVGAALVAGLDGH